MQGHECGERHKLGGPPPPLHAPRALTAAAAAAPAAAAAAAGAPGGSHSPVPYARAGPNTGPGQLWVCVGGTLARHQGGAQGVFVCVCICECVCVCVCGGGFSGGKAYEGDSGGLKA